MVLVNSGVMIVYMVINSSVCEDGMSGGECVKHLDNQIFLFQMVVNLLFSGYCLVKVDRSKWGILLLNLLLITIIYVAFAAAHSISKAGLF